MIPKIQIKHTEKPAYVYIRQSSVNQVRYNQESTERQYALKNKAIELGWQSEKIHILDQDLGKSGAHMAGREGFKTLVADVSMRAVGAVFALEASRLARSCADWHRLLELCATTGTLIIDEDGCYNPADFNDQLLLGLKGSMSQAELHFLRARLLGGKRNKAKRGELRLPLPVGFVYDDKGQIVFDPDEQVQEAIRLVFAVFREVGSVYGIVHKFGNEGFTFPKRAYGGSWAGKLIWGRLTRSRARRILTTPCYAGAYVSGRFRTVKNILPDGTIQSKLVETPMSSWLVLIKDHHEGYISWDDFIRNKKTIVRNRNNREDTLLSGSAREGAALLQGLLLCGICGHRVSVRYKGNGGRYTSYECHWRENEGLSTTSCIMIRGDLLDRTVSKRVLEILEPNQIQIAMKAVEELERREEVIEKQWRMRIERAEYEAQLAQRRYEEVDPANRLVASTLERRWNDALIKVEEIKKERKEHKNSKRRVATPEQKAKLMSLAKDLPRLWNASKTKAKDRKHILRLLIKDITLDKTPNSKKATLHIRWQGGACESIPVQIPPHYSDQIRYSREMVEKVRNLARKFNDNQIAKKLNREGRRSATGKVFNKRRVQWIRYKYKIPAPVLKHPEEITVKELAEKFGVSKQMVYYWIERKIITARRLNACSPYWITIDSEKEKELVEWVRNSCKIPKRHIKHSHGKL